MVLWHLRRTKDVPSCLDLTQRQLCRIANGPFSIALKEDLVTFCLMTIYIVSSSCHSTLRRETSPLALPEASSPHPDLIHHVGFILSCASVENVVALRVYRRNTRDRMEVMGLLFRYLDGTEASVGQVRFDQLDEVLTTDGFQSLHLRFSRSGMLAPYIAKFETSVEQLDDSASMWFEVSWSGTLEGWIS